MITHAIDGFLCDRERPEEYFRILRRLSNAPTEFDSVSTAAWNTVLSRYSADALSAQYEPLFNRTTRGKAPKCERKAVHVSDTAALPDFPGIVLQCKHRLADLWLALAKGRRPVELRPD
jgi:hypothetical protein